MCLKVVVGRQHLSSDQLFLQYCYEVKEVLGVAVAYVIQFVWWHRQAVVTHRLLGSMSYHSCHALYNVVNIRKVAQAITVIEDLDCLSVAQFVGETEICHVGASCGAVDGEEAKPCRGNVVQL